MIIEFYGLPGTGKSTIARAIAGQGKFKKIKIQNKRELLWYNFLFFLKRPIIFIYLFWYIVKNSNNWGIFYFKFMNVFMHCNAKYQKARQYQYSLIDQGYFQNIISIFEKQVSWRKIGEYLSYAYLPDKLFIFQTEETQRLKRLSSRNYGLYDCFNQQEMANWLEASQINHQTLIDNLAELGIKHYIIFNNKEISQVLQEIDLCLIN